MSKQHHIRADAAHTPQNSQEAAGTALMGKWASKCQNCHRAKKLPSAEDKTGGIHMKRFRSVIKAIFNVFAVLIGADCEWRRQAVDDGACDFGGQGKDKYGR